MGTAQLILIGAVVLLGLICVPAPGVPGTLLCWAALLWWAASEHSGPTWALLAGATGVLALGQVVVWLMPSRRIRDSGVGWRTVMSAGRAAVLGFFLFPVLGGPLAFVGTIYTHERLRLGGGHRATWSATRRVMRTVGNSVLVELMTCLLVTAAWITTVITHS